MQVNVKTLPWIQASQWLDDTEILPRYPIMQIGYIAAANLGSGWGLGGERTCPGPEPR